MQPSTFELRDFESKFSGNVIEICPVGALTNREYRFRARPWDLQTKPAICTVCSNGCNVWFDYRVGQMVRINGRTNEAVNEEWTCDKGKFGHDFYNEKRLTKPMIRNGDRLVECDWPTAYAAILNAFSANGDKVALLGGQDTMNEGVHLMVKLFKTQFKSGNIDYRWTKHLQTSANRLESVLGQKQVQSSIASFESKASVLVFGCSLAEDEPIVFLRVRKGWFKNGTRVVVALDRDSEADSFAHLVLRYQPGTESALANGLLAAAVESGRAKVPDATKAALPSVEDAAKACGVPADRIREAAGVLGENGAVVTSYSLFNAPNAQDTLETLGGLAMCVGAEFNCYGLNANDQGCEELGLIPTNPKARTHDILGRCADGSIEALWLLNADPFALHSDREQVEKALENVGFLVVQATNENEALAFASVVLPMAAPAESDGTYVNCERRLQEIKAVLPPKGEAKTAWRIASELLLRSGIGKPYFNPGEALDEIRATVPAFAGVEAGELLK
jgi:NADH-quinone oxidoreductase subunit G